MVQLACFPVCYQTLFDDVREGAGRDGFDPSAFFHTGGSTPSQTSSVCEDTLKGGRAQGNSPKRMKDWKTSAVCL